MASIVNHNSRVGQLVYRIQELSTALPVPRRKEEQGHFANSATLLLEGMSLPSSQRIIVIVPGIGIEYYGLANKLWALANPDRRDILLIGVYEGDGYEFEARRNLTSLAMATRDNHVKVQMQTVESRDLFGALRAAQEPGDIILLPERMMIHGFFSKIKLAKRLTEILKAPMYCMDLEIEEDRSWFHYLWMEYALTLLALISVVAITGAMIWLNQMQDGVIRTIIQILALIVEVRILWAIVNASH